MIDDCFKTTLRLPFWVSDPVYAQMHRSWWSFDIFLFKNSWSPVAWRGLHWYTRPRHPTGSFLNRCQRLIVYFRRCTTWKGNMRITHTSVFVSDQSKALAFYTKILGFVKKQDQPAGKFRWLTVVAPGDLNGTELLLEPDDNPVAQAYQKGLFTQGIPAASFGVEDIDTQHERLKSLGVKFTMSPTEIGEATVAVFDDTCGNLIQIMQTRSWLVGTIF